jgi:hypothetical protein
MVCCKSGQPDQGELTSTRRTTCWRAQQRRLITVPSRILVGEPVMSTAKRTLRKSPGSSAIAV